MDASARAAVLLVTRDERLADAVCRQARPAGAVCVCDPADLSPATLQQCAHLWIDLAAYDGFAIPASCQRVYFYPRSGAAKPALPPGLYLPKPVSQLALRVVWAGVEAGAAAETHAARTRRAARVLPGWISEYHDLRLRALCRKLVTRLGARLGYRDVSLYVHEEERGALTLVETSHDRPIERTFRVPEDDGFLMVAVARSGQVLQTERVLDAFALCGLPTPDHHSQYPDDACLIAPLRVGAELVGVLNLAQRTRTAPHITGDRDAIFAFLARTLRHALIHDRTRTEARVDNLTGLFNRRGITEAIAKEIHRAERFGQPLSVIMLDLDGLKAVNDRVGHPAGDFLLRQVGRRMRAGLRDADTAARLGGDEFVALLPGTDLAGGQHVARRLLVALRSEPAIYRGSELPISASLGIAMWESGDDVHRVLEAADQAMYRAKSAGGDRVAFANVNDAQVTLTSRFIEEESSPRAPTGHKPPAA